MNGDLNLSFFISPLYLQNGSTPLMWASFNGNTEIMEYLIKMKAEMEIQDNVSMNYLVREIETNYLNFIGWRYSSSFGLFLE